MAIVSISPEILKKIFDYLKIPVVYADDPRQTFCRFWIACFSQKNFQPKLHAALSQLKLSCYFVKHTSELNKYVTSTRIFGKHLCLDKLKKLFVCRYFSELSSMPLLSKLHVSKILKLSELKLLPTLQYLDADNIEFDEQNIVFPLLLTLKTSLILQSYESFPNLCSLIVKSEDCSYFEKHKNVDLSCLKFLEHLCIKHVFASENQVRLNEFIDVQINNLVLKTARLHASIGLIPINVETTILFPLLEKLEVRFDSESEWNRNFRTSNLFNMAPFLHTFSAKYFTFSAIESLSKFKQIRSLSLIYFTSWTQDGRIIPISPLRSQNLSELKLKCVSVTGSQIPFLVELCSTVTKLEWSEVKYCPDHDLSSDPKHFAPGILPENLISLKAKIFSNDWIQLIPKLVAVQFLDLSNYSVQCLTRQTFYDQDICAFYDEFKMNSAEFLAKFSVERIKWILLQWYAYYLKHLVPNLKCSGTKFCQILIYREKIFDHIDDYLNTDTILKNLWDSCHNSQILSHVKKLSAKFGISLGENLNLSSFFIHPIFSTWTQDKIKFTCDH
jgi:hypothetical protein